MTDTSLIEAARAGNLETVREIINKADGEIDSITLTAAFNDAAFNGHLQVLKSLLASGADPNARDQNDMSSLDCALANLDVDAIKFLLANGADVNAHDQFGQSPLHLAIDNEAEYAKSLNDDGDVDALPTAESTDILIMGGASVNSRNLKGETPLRWAMSQHHQAAEKLLRERGGIL